MTIAQAIAQVDARKPNQFKNNDKIGWLSELDLRFWGEVINTHEGHEDYASFSGYDAGTALSTELLIPAPYDAVYPQFLAAKIDQWNGEYTRFESTAALYNLAYKTAADAWGRAHLPLQIRTKMK